jgi:hypothetical protein
MSVIFNTVASQEGNSPQFQDLGQVLRNAQLRRTADLGGWLRQYFADRRQARLQKQGSPSTTVMSLQRSAAG